MKDGGSVVKFKGLICKGLGKASGKDYIALYICYVLYCEVIYSKFVQLRI